MTDETRRIILFALDRLGEDVALWWPGHEVGDFLRMVDAAIAEVKETARGA